MMQEGIDDEKHKVQMAEEEKGIRRSGRDLKPKARNEPLKRLISKRKNLNLSEPTGELAVCRGNSSKKPRNVDAKRAVKEGNVKSVQKSSTSTVKNKNFRAKSTKKAGNAPLADKQGGDNDNDTVDTSSTSTAKTDDCLSVKHRTTLPMDRGSDITTDNTIANGNKTQYRYEINVSEMAERNTINMVNFKKYLQKRFMEYGIKHKLANRVTVENKDFDVVVTTEIFFKKSVLKYHAKKFLKMEKLRHFVKVVEGKNKYSYRFMYYSP